MEAKTIISIVSFSFIVACGVWSIIINRRTLKRLDDNYKKLKELYGRK